MELCVIEAFLCLKYNVPDVDTCGYVYINAYGNIW